MFITAHLINPDSASCVSEVCTCTEGWIEDLVAGNGIACIEGKESERKRDRKREKERSRLKGKKLGKEEKKVCEREEKKKRERETWREE